jgi:hypothetical protein
LVASSESASSSAPSSGRPAEESRHIELDHVDLNFGSRVVFDDLHVEFARGKIHVLMGGSGAGKSTLLRMIGGLQRPDRGRVRVGGKELVWDPPPADTGEVELVRAIQRLQPPYREVLLLHLHHRARLMRNLMFYSFPAGFRPCWWYCSRYESVLGKCVWLLFAVR